MEEGILADTIVAVSSFEDIIIAISIMQHRLYAIVINSITDYFGLLYYVRN